MIPDQFQFTADELALATGGASFGVWVWDLGADNIRWSSKLGDIYGIDASLYPTNATELLDILPASVGINLKADILASVDQVTGCLLYTSPSPRDKRQSRMPSSA